MSWHFKLAPSMPKCQVTQSSSILTRTTRKLSHRGAHLGAPHGASAGAGASDRRMVLVRVIRAVVRAIRVPLRRPLEPLLWIAASLSAKDVWVGVPKTPLSRATPRGDPRARRPRLRRPLAPTPRTPRARRDISTPC